MKILGIILFSFFLASGSVVVGLKWLEQWAHDERTFTEPVEVEIAPGSSGREVAQNLGRYGVVDNPWLFEIWARLQGLSPRFQAGRYRFEGPVSPIGASEMLVTGKVHRELVLSITVPEGQTAQKIFQRLAEQGIGLGSLEALFVDPGFLAAMNVPGASAEGFLYPATYNFYDRLPEAEDVLRAMIKKFFVEIDATLLAELAAKGLSAGQAATFASLIELETALEEEKPMVAEVIWNRLNKGMPLGIDAALIYGISDYQGDIKWSHLRDEKNPYNTRIHGGLPPGPIGSPSRSSFLAILNPTREGYYYYVLKSMSGGGHAFSRTLQEHNRNVDQLKRQRR